MNAIIDTWKGDQKSLSGNATKLKTVSAHTYQNGCHKDQRQQNIGEDVEEKVLLCTFNVNWCRQFMENQMELKLSYDSQQSQFLSNATQSWKWKTGQGR